MPFVRTKSPGAAVNVGSADGLEVDVAVYGGRRSVGRWGGGTQARPPTGLRWLFQRVEKTHARGVHRTRFPGDLASNRGVRFSQKEPERKLEHP